MSHLQTRIAGAVVALSIAAIVSAQPSGAVLWSDPGPIASKDVRWGTGSAERQPVAPFTFIEEDMGGTTPKVVVKDAKGVEWDVKLGVESHSEVAANRIVWLFGYPVQEMYYLPQGTIQGVRNLKRADRNIKSDGTFREARFRRRDAQMQERGGWEFNKNPFAGSREMSGVILLMALLNNWDTDGVRNTEIMQVETPSGTEQWYMVQDLGASFGRFTNRDNPVKWSLSEFQQEKYIEKVDGTTVHVNYKAYGTPPRTVPLEHAKWFATLAGQLTLEQLRTVFETAGASATEAQGFASRVMQKIQELQAAVNPTR